MKKEYKTTYTIRGALKVVLLVSLLTAGACKKQDDFLDAKRKKGDVVPTTLKDLQAVLDNTNVMNKNYCEMGLVGSDNNFVTDDNLDASPQYERNAYLWAKDIYQGQTDYDWMYAYQMVEYANVVLDGLAKLSPGNSNAYNNIKGSALFYRSMAFYELSQLYCKPYDAKTANGDLGIPVRLSSDVNIKSERNTVQQCYDQMVNDLKTAAGLLPLTPLYTTRPSSVAAKALLAKVYFSKEDYSNAGDVANQALQGFSTLLDFAGSSIDPTSDFRFPPFATGNPEMIFYAECPSYYTVDSYPSDYGYVNPVLYSSYDDNDLRKTLFFNDYGGGAVKFQGNYTGTYNNFGGIASNEIYLIRAECYARAGDIPSALKDLNTLLVKRYKKGTYTPKTASNASEALKVILTERRKELPFTAQLRWEDLRRLNKDPQLAATIQRIYKGTSYTLMPNDKRYVFPIPDLEIQLYGLKQNER